MPFRPSIGEEYFSPKSFPLSLFIVPHFVFLFHIKSNQTEQSEKRSSLRSSEKLHREHSQLIKIFASGYFGCFINYIPVFIE